MKSVGLIVAILLLAAVAIVAFTKSRKVHEAALAPITVTPTGPLEPAPPLRPATPNIAPTDAVPPDEDAMASGSAGAPQPEASEAEPAAPPEDTTQAQGCEAELKAMGVVFEPQPPITDEAGCGVERPLEVSSVGIALKPAVTTRCEVAKALAVWTKDVVIPSAALHLKATPTAISTGDAYQCRARRGEGEVKVSEHARANAVDITGIEFSDHAAVQIMDRAGSADDARAFQAAIRGGACAYFTTVLGPGTNAAHADHLHVDMIARRNGYRICE